MRAVKWIVGIVGFLAVVFLGGVLMIDPRYRVERSTVVNAPPARIYPLISAPKEWMRWTVWNEREPNMKTSFSGPPAGQGAKWEWEGQDGKGLMEFTAAEPDKSITYRLGFVEMNMFSTGALTLTPQCDLTRVSWTNEGDMGKNPMMRWFAPFMDRMMGPDFEAGLAKLKALAEKP